MSPAEAGSPAAPTGTLQDAPLAGAGEISWPNL